MVTLVLVSRHLHGLHITKLGMNLTSSGIQWLSLILHLYRITSSPQNGNLPSPVLPQSSDPVLPSGYV